MSTSISTRIYGDKIDPSGMLVALDEDSFIGVCPCCNQEAAVFSSWEANDGGCINLHHSMYCCNCGHREPDKYADY